MSTHRPATHTGLAYPYNFYEQNPSFVTSVASVQTSFTERYLLFLYPFTWSVLGGLFVLWLINGLAIGIIEGNLP